MLDATTCYRALTARDVRFDGVFFVGVATTGIYCRPVCPARTPRRDRVRFFRTAAEAERLGFRACFRCRPERAPGSASIDAVPALVSRAVARIEAGFLDDHSVDELASELGVTARHLRRATSQELGVSLLELAQTRRLSFARQLLRETAISLTDVAFASGFSSVRQFNAAFRERHGAAPSLLRKLHAERPAAGVSLALDYRPPLDHGALLDFLGARSIPGVSEVRGGVHRRSVRIDGRTGIIDVSPDPARPRLHVHASDGLERALTSIVRRVRATFDLDAHPAPIAEALGADRWLGPLVRRRPGLRVPGAFDPFETAVLAILGQQVSVRAACTLAGRLAARFGAPLDSAGAGSIGLVFPDPAAIARVRPRELAAIGIVRTRAEALCALARALDSGALVLERGGDADAARRRLLELPGIGPWTAEYVCLRVLGWPDAFPASDLGLRRALRVDEKELARRAERWRPWRGYAALHLWQSLRGDDP